MKLFRLPFQFDAEGMAREVAALPPHAWTSHFNAGYHDGGWSGVALRAPGGDAYQLYPDPEATQEYTDTAIRAACPVIDAALLQFGPALRSARLLRLAPGSTIREHRDYGLGLESGEARLHVPITSGPGVEFYLDGELVPMLPGECWYLNLDLPHRVQNLGTSDRVHLVVDCLAVESVTTRFPAAEEQALQLDEIRARAAGIDSAQRRLDRFRLEALADPGLVRELAREADRDRFIERVVAAGRERRLEFSAEDVRATLEAGRRDWFDRWTVR